MPQGTWAWLAEHPEDGAIFDEAMIAKSFAHVAAVVECYDFSCHPRIADIGGGRGHLLRAILDKWPEPSGILFDQAHVVAGVEPADRLDRVAGDFFSDALPVAEAYVLMEVIHDWNDEESAAILGAVARAAPPGAPPRLIEQLLPETPGPAAVKMLDVHMLVLITGRQRSRDEYDDLAVRAGFEPVSATDTGSGVAILEYRRR
jgi:hypothetical protein